MTHTPGGQIEARDLFRIPKGSGCLGLLILAALYASLFVLPIANIVYLIKVGDFRLLIILSILCSIAWLLLMTALGWELLRECDGLKHAAVHVLAFIASDHFAWIARGADGHRTITFSFRFLGRRFDLAIIELDGIESVIWGHGQASALAGRDMSDWSTALWFSTSSARLLRARLGPWDKDHTLHAIGPGGTRDKVEAFAMSFVGFLRDHGVVLEKDAQRRPGAGGIGYKRPGAADPPADAADRSPKA